MHAHYITEKILNITQRLSEVGLIFNITFQDLACYCCPLFKINYAVLLYLLHSQVVSKLPLTCFSYILSKPFICLAKPGICLSSYAVGSTPSLFMPRSMQQTLWLAPVSVLWVEIHFLVWSFCPLSFI